MSVPLNSASNIILSDRRQSRGGLAVTRRITDRQLECLYWVFHGKSASDIGSILGISGRVVEEHLQKACAHLGLRSRHQAAWRAHELGLLPGVAP